MMNLKRTKDEIEAARAEGRKMSADGIPSGEAYARMCDPKIPEECSRAMSEGFYEARHGKPLPEAT